MLWRSPALPLPLLALALLGCGGGDLFDNVPHTDARPAPVRRTVTVEPGTLDVQHATLPLTPAPRGLAVFGARAGVGTATGFQVASAEGALALAGVRVLADPGVPGPTGAVEAVATREGGGALVALAGGALVHEADGVLFRSPLSGVLPPDAVQALHARGTGAGEELWLTYADRALFVGAGERIDVRLPGRAAPQGAVGVGHRQGLLSVEGDLWEVVPRPAGARPYLAGAGAVHGAFSASGRTYVALDAGLLVRGEDGSATLTAFTTPEGEVLPVRAAALGDGALHVVAGRHLLRQVGGGFRRVASAPDGVRALAVDGHGDAWTATPAGLTRSATGAAVTFTEVLPFLERHCVQCHRDGTDGAPVYDLQQYDVVKALHPRILARLADAASPMPPRRVAVLAPEDWEVVVRWANGGLKP